MDNEVIMADEVSFVLAKRKEELDKKALGYNKGEQELFKKNLQSLLEKTAEKQYPEFWAKTGISTPRIMAEAVTYDPDMYNAIVNEIRGSGKTNWQEALNEALAEGINLPVDKVKQAIWGQKYRSPEPQKPKPKSRPAPSPSPAKPSGSWGGIFDVGKKPREEIF